MSKPIDKAILIIGGLSATAKIFKIRPWAVSKWRKKVPPERVLAIEQATQGKVTRYELRPDIYGDDPETFDKPKRKKAA